MATLDTTARTAAVRGVQHRSFEFRDFEFRDEGNKGFTFDGVASVVDTPYEVRDQWGSFTETIAAGAFNKTLKDSKADVALFVNHDTRALPLATRLDGSLRLAADPHLRVTATLNPARPSVQEVRHAVNDGQARQMSIGFSVPEKRDEWSGDFSTRVIREVNLAETSIVWRGASPTTSGSMRSYNELLRSLNDASLTRDEYRRIAAHMQHRFADLFDNMIEDRLRDELAELLGLEGMSMDGEGPSVCVVDHTDNVVIYCCYGTGDDDMYQLSYEADADGNITLSSDAPIVVQPVTSYVPEPPETGDMAMRSDHTERDRDSFARLDLLIADKPRLLLV
jgi:HK97 family phage prohead protease